MKRFVLFICSITLSIAIQGQELYPSEPQESKIYGVDAFHSVCVGDSFEITLKEGKCAVQVDADKVLIPYILVYVREGILHIEMDEKSIPVEVKRVYRGKNAPIAIKRARVSIPCINQLTATQNAVLRSEGSILSDSLQFKLQDKAIVRELRIDAQRANLDLSKNSQSAQMEIRVESQLEVNARNSTYIKMKYKAQNFLLQADNASTLMIEGESSTASFSLGGNAKCRASHQGNVLVLNANNNSKLSLSGELNDLNLTATQFCEVEGLDMKIQRVKAEMNGRCRAELNVEELLSVNLAGGSALYYTGVPAIQVGKILKSTFSPYEENNKE